MGWSTQELADLAGTTVNAVRHYHRAGVLDEPGRTPNGYKQYRADHLVRLVQVRRLRDSGVPLAQVRGILDGDPGSAGALHALYGELGSTIDRLQRMRDQLAAVREHRVPVDTPERFVGVPRPLGDRDRALVSVFARVWQGDRLEDLRRLVSERDDYEDDLDALPADADDATIDAIAGRMAEALARDHARFPWLRDPTSGSTGGRALVESVVGPVIAEMYNAAQIAVFLRAVARLAPGTPVG
ncbi:helix-turn-helix domain-containing protein [Pseudonocardia sp. HH130630-07]|uniref:helix-turn-helix domain-containing protein n=1 Tax=Pseudonocardia sp. HH130630-07 TaxID=1690815 RepID=UPI0008153DF1|nr:MerR family transcriptional regulator [Pseudonocardia sp. HH130630-07]ANY06509.1 hypothetical protein AFB00_09635 [Pseudonocardia sp. HH130630-07]